MLMFSSAHCRALDQGRRAGDRVAVRVSGLFHLMRGTGATDDTEHLTPDRRLPSRSRCRTRQNRSLQKQQVSHVDLAVAINVSQY